MYALFLVTVLNKKGPASRVFVRRVCSCVRRIQHSDIALISVREEELDEYFSCDILLIFQ